MKTQQQKTQLTEKDKVSNKRKVKSRTAKRQQITNSQKKKLKIDKTIIVAIIGGVFVLIAAYLQGVKPVDMVIVATKTAEAARTQAANLAATSTAIAQQNLQTYTISINLPGAHTPPNSVGGAQPIANEKIAIRIQIPAIGVDVPIVQGEGWDEFKLGVVQKLGTANPGENGFTILSAYNDMFGEIFRDLDKLQSGDEIILYTLKAEYSYLVESSSVLSTSTLDLEFNPNQSMVVLTSQYPYLQDDSWIVVFAYPK